jgi:hypothetical protein
MQMLALREPAMTTIRLPRKPPVSREAFSQWAQQCSGIDFRHWQALRLCWTYLTGAGQRVLDIGPDPLPWLRTIRHFSRQTHELWAGRQGISSTQQNGSAPVDGIRCLDVELDLWSPVARIEADNVLPPQHFSLITALHVVETVYHPSHFFQGAADALLPDGVLIVTARNVAASSQILDLLRGNGLAPDLGNLIGDPKVSPRYRQYCWRELHAAARPAGLVLVGHGFYSDAADRAVSEDQGRLEAAAAPLLPEKQQLESEFFLILQKSVGLRRALARARHKLAALRTHVRRRLVSGGSR